MKATRRLKAQRQAFASPAIERSIRAKENENRQGDTWPTTSGK